MSKHGSVQSTATQSEIAYYTEGSCHILAAALHRMTGWPIHLVLDNGEEYWSDPTDPDNYIPSTVHAFCVDPDDRFWDIQGVRPRDAVYKEMNDRYTITDYDSIELDEEGLRTFVGYWAESGEEPIDRPLESYDDQEIREATEVVERVLASVPEFGFGRPNIAPAI